MAPGKQESESYFPSSNNMKFYDKPQYLPSNWGEASSRIGAGFAGMDKPIGMRFCSVILTYKNNLQLLHQRGERE